MSEKKDMMFKVAGDACMRADKEILQRLIDKLPEKDLEKVADFIGYLINL